MHVSISCKQCQFCFGPISHFIEIWCLCDSNFTRKWHSHSLLFYNQVMLVGGGPISPPLPKYLTAWSIAHTSYLPSQGHSWFFLSSRWDMVARPPLPQIWLRCHLGKHKDVSNDADHQQIHFNYLHGSYLTPRKLQLMGKLNGPLCTLRSMKVPVTLIHMMLVYPPVSHFWNQVAIRLPQFLSINVPTTKMPEKHPVSLCNDCQ